VYPAASRWHEHPLALSKQGTSWLRGVVLIADAAILIWQVTTRSLVAYLASAAPETTLPLRSTMREFF
jgi:hypothetical protein